MKRFLPFLTFLLAAVAHLGQAQVATTSLIGSVQTDEHKPLTSAAITVIHLPSGARHAAASDATGQFVIPNLLVGGPYVLRVGVGGYRSETMESIFLGTGKTSPFAVTLSKLSDTNNSTARNKGDRSEKTITTETLAPESVVGGPVLFSTSTATTGTRAAAASAPRPMAARPQPALQVMPAAAPAPAPAPAPASALVVNTPAPAPARYARASRYPPRRTTPPATDFIVPGRYDAKTGNYIYDTGQPTTLKLPGGTTITGVGTNSTESILHHFLDDPKVVIDSVDLTRGWFNFDRVFFDAGKATLTAESVRQLRNVATLMRAYPKARIKLGGYTDSTGTYKVNKLLSDARARTAWASLVEMGVSPSRVEARGYGPRYSIAPNVSDEGRAKNRRLSVKVIQK